MSGTPRSGSFRLLSLALLSASAMVLGARGDPAEDEVRALIVKATTADTAKYHVVFRETLKSTEQGDWTGHYNASVELFIDGHSVLKVAGSTLPNYEPSGKKPADWKYSVVRSTCAFPPDLRSRHYSWTRGKRSDGTRPCLRLAAEVPAANVGTERNVEVLVPLLRAIRPSDLHYALDILVHEGATETHRGSAGCLTIRPEDAEQFFNAIPEGTKGTVDVQRGVEDVGTHSSSCY